MLLVNGIRPFQENYNNQNVNKVTFSQPQLHTKADSVSFTSLASEADKATQAKLVELTQKVGVEFADIFGENSKKIIGEMHRFLAEYGVSIQHEIGIMNLRTRPELTASCYDAYINGFKATLVNQEGKPIHDVGGLPGDIGSSVIDVTKNAASVYLFHNLSIGNVTLNNPNHALKFVQYPDALTKNIKKIDYALMNFRRQWRNIGYNSQQLKAEHLQDACRKLMSEE